MVLFKIVKVNMYENATAKYFKIIFTNSYTH